jgi:hypothetical protein
MKRFFRGVWRAIRWLFSIPPRPPRDKDWPDDGHW